MKSILKTFTLAFIGTLILSSCSNTKTTTSAVSTTKSKPSYDAQAKDSKAKQAVAIKSSPNSVKAVSTVSSKKALTTKKSIQNNIRK